MKGIEGSDHITLPPLQLQTSRGLRCTDARGLPCATASCKALRLRAAWPALPRTPGLPPWRHLPRGATLALPLPLDKVLPVPCRHWRRPRDSCASSSASISYQSPFSSSRSGIGFSVVHRPASTWYGRSSDGHVEDWVDSLSCLGQFQLVGDFAHALY